MDEELTQQLNMCKMADKIYQPNPSLLESLQPGGRIVPGNVRQIKFIDGDVAYWQNVRQHYMVHGTSTKAPKPSAARPLEGQRWVPGLPAAA